MSERLETWAIVELFGHTKIAGMVTEATIAGGAFLRVDVPATSSSPGWTRYVGPTAVFAINPVAEDIARHAAERIDARPVQPWEMPRPKVPLLEAKAASEPTKTPPAHGFARDIDDSEVCADCGEDRGWEGHGEAIVDHDFACNSHSESIDECGTCGEHRHRHTTKEAIANYFGAPALDDDNRDLEDQLGRALGEGEE